MQAESTYYNTLPVLEKGDSEGFKKSLVKTKNNLKKFHLLTAYRLRVIVLQNFSIMLQNDGREKARTMKQQRREY